jgi:two-component system, OmpR family, response regulator ChvI
MATATPSSTSSENNKKIRILLVDDEKDVAIALKVLLEDEEYKEEKREQNTITSRSSSSSRSSSKEFEVDVFNDPESALSNFKSGRYDLLLLDIVMPKMNGFELYEEIKKIDDKVKVCFLTAFGEGYNEEFRTRFPSFGSSLSPSLPSPSNVSFIRKPIRIDDLVKKVNEIITVNPEGDHYF